MDRVHVLLMDSYRDIFYAKALLDVLGTVVIEECYGRQVGVFS